MPLPSPARRLRRSLSVVAIAVTSVVVPLAAQFPAQSAPEEELIDSAQSLAQAAPGDGRALAKLIDTVVSGETALEVFDGRIADLAARNGMPTEELQQVLADDATVRIDRDARLFHVEPVIPGAEAAGPDSSLSAADLAADVFALNSLPGASRVIYLDFNGYTLTNSAWNPGSTVQITPYDTDSTPGTFSTAERAVVQETWQRVAEDYAPFGINVTTQDPGADALNRSSSSDQTYGSRVVIDPTGWYYGPKCTCGGVAYIGTFDSANNGYNQPAWVFTKGVGTSAKNLAEVSSHEAGHNLGLGHDATSTVGYYAGHGAWAPIMGSGYGRAITQWSRGEYSGANNREDDFTVMGQNGAPLRETDHGTTPDTATEIELGLTVSGVNAAQDDVDHFRITVPEGTRTFTASPAAIGGNLDISLSVLDSAGEVLATWNPNSGQKDAATPTGLGATGTLDLPAGTYVVRVDDTGFGNPLNTGYSTYGSHGAFTILVS